MNARIGKKGPGLLVLASYGFHPHQITLEAALALKNCGTVYSDAVDRGSKKTLEELGLKIISFAQGLSHNEKQRRILSEVARGATIGYLTYGDTLFLNSLTASLLRECREGRTPHRIYSGVSSAAALLGVLFDGGLGEGGVYITAPDCRIDGLNPRIPALIFLLAKDAASERLLRRLGRLYPKSHKVDFIHCSFADGLRLEKKTYALSELTRKWKTFKSLSMTLFVPSI